MAQIEIIKRLDRVASIIEMDSKNPDNVNRAKEIRELLKMLEKNMK
jgi:hypothetical protein